MKTRFGGIWPAMVTPTTQDGKPALSVCEQLVDLFARQGMGGIYLGGSTGQWPLFTPEERMAIVELRGQGAGRADPGHGPRRRDRPPRMPSAGPNMRREVGAAAVSAVGPIYYQHPADVIFEYYRRIGAATDLPLFVYHLSVVNQLSLGPREYARAPAASCRTSRG